MPAQEESDLLSIGDVVAALRPVYPEISHSSLRFLEREGLIQPERTAGGHRLFSRPEVERIKQIKEWQEQRLSLADVRARLAAQEGLQPEELAERFVEAVLQGDPGAGQILLRADDLGMPLQRQFQDVLRPALVTVGDRWEREELRVGQEHEVTEVARDVIADLSLRHADPHPAGAPMLAACVAGERHDLGLRMVVGLLRSQGQPVHFLGADVESGYLQEEVERRQPAAVLLSATRSDRLPSVKAAAEAVQRAAGPRSMTIVLGGQAVTGHAAEIREWGVVPVRDDDLDVVLQSLIDAGSQAHARTTS